MSEHFTMSVADQHQRGFGIKFTLDEVAKRRMLAQAYMHMITMDWLKPQLVPMFIPPVYTTYKPVSDISLTIDKSSFKEYYSAAYKSQRNASFFTELEDPDDITDLSYVLFCVRNALIKYEIISNPNWDIVRRFGAAGNECVIGLDRMTRSLIVDESNTRKNLDSITIDNFSFIDSCPTVYAKFRSIFSTFGINSFINTDA